MIERIKEYIERYIQGRARDMEGKVDFYQKGSLQDTRTD
jgi:hypothetical protein